MHVMKSTSESSLIARVQTDPEGMDPRASLDPGHSVIAAVSLVVLGTVHVSHYNAEPRRDLGIDSRRAEIGRARG